MTLVKNPPPSGCEEGWLLDCYPSQEREERPDERGMTFWIKRKDGSLAKIRDREWHAKIYACGPACDDPGYLLAKVEGSGLVRSIRRTYRRANLSTRKMDQVLEIELAEAGKSRRIGELLEGFFANPVTFSLFNVDVLPEQQYFYEKDIFPLAFVRVDFERSGSLNWHLLDSVSSYDYLVPDLRCLRLDLDFSDCIPTFDSRLRSVRLTPLDGHDEAIVIESSDEGEMLYDMVNEISRLDPDIVVTRNGDSFGLPFLYSKARKHAIDLHLNRDEAAGSFTQNSSSPKTYFSYGKILYRPATQRLYGRLHLDEENTFIYDQCRLEGLFEISRLCRIPLHTSMRASIGKCLSSLQFYTASQHGILIPWKPKVAEDFKSGYELLLADRGGLVLEPLQGVYHGVAELDFASLYPSIIRLHNISAETVNCECCSLDDEEEQLAPQRNELKELGMHICRKERGIVARSLDLPVRKRFEYKRLRDSTEDRRLKLVYNERAGALKWVLVCCFGYLSYRNAKFGKIDSHIAVCAIARKTLLDAMHTAETRGYRVIHGIVDSLWLSKEGAMREDYLEVCDEIESATNFKISLEGVYKWIVFLPSRTNPSIQVANRYFGCFEGTNEIKTRGIETRRHDTPSYFKECQYEILQRLAVCETLGELQQEARSEAIDIFEKYARRLEQHDVPASELIINKRLSKELVAYNSRRQLSVAAADRLEAEGRRLSAGQTISYVITHYRTDGKMRAIPEELMSEVPSQYDSERYVELLADCCSTVLSPFGITKKTLLSRTKFLE